jgi:diguanylate cyclase (GGDEF)-like protein
LVVTASIGVATYDPTNEAPQSVETLMTAADAAMYQAKLHGRNRMSAA